MSIPNTKVVTKEDWFRHVFTVYDKLLWNHRILTFIDIILMYSVWFMYLVIIKINHHYFLQMVQKYSRNEVSVCLDTHHTTDRVFLLVFFKFSQICYHIFTSYTCLLRTQKLFLRRFGLDGFPLYMKHTFGIIEF
jgi:hypothetical protein